MVYTLTYADSLFLYNNNDFQSSGIDHKYSHLNKSQFLIISDCQSGL